MKKMAFIKMKSYIPYISYIFHIFMRKKIMEAAIISRRKMIDLKEDTFKVLSVVCFITICQTTIWMWS